MCHINVKSPYINGFCVCLCLVGPDIQCFAPELLEGETLEKHCPVTGNPTPIVMWLKDGQPTDPASPLSREKAGTYTVRAEGASLAQKELQVLVLCKCPVT